MFHQKILTKFFLLLFDKEENKTHNLLVFRHYSFEEQIFFASSHLYTNVSFFFLLLDTSVRSKDPFQVQYSLTVGKNKCRRILSRKKTGFDQTSNFTQRLSNLFFKNCDINQWHDYSSNFFTIMILFIFEFLTEQHNS